MIHDLKPYPSYKDSGVAWLEEVPEHWIQLKLKFTSKLIVGGSTPQKEHSEYWDGDVIWVTPEDISKANKIDRSITRV